VKVSIVVRVLGASFLGSGAALVIHIVSGVSLRLALVLTIGLMAVAVRSIWQRTLARDRSWLVRRLGVGLIAGSLATVSYDIAKFVFALLDPSSYNPFEVIRVFGKLLIGPSMPAVAVYAAGTAFHFLNGISFGTAFCLLFRRHGVLAGIAWSLFLELFQLTLYPGWLDIRFYQEFVQISALSHIVYGMVLGFSCRYALHASALTGEPRREHNDGPKHHGRYGR
jgi:hypothetical protein